MNRPIYGGVLLSHRHFPQHTHKPSIPFPLGESTSSTHKTGKRALLSSAPHLVKSQRKERGAKGNKKNPSFLSIEFRLMAPSLSSRQEFFLGKSNNLKLMLEYCILSKVELEESDEVLDESDLMTVRDFNCILEFY